jgi:hypothetical protein
MEWPTLRGFKPAVVTDCHLDQMNLGELTYLKSF